MSVTFPVVCLIICTFCSANVIVSCPAPGGQVLILQSSLQVHESTTQSSRYLFLFLFHLPTPLQSIRLRVRASRSRPRKRKPSAGRSSTFSFPPYGPFLLRPSRSSSQRQSCKSRVFQSYTRSLNAVRPVTAMKSEQAIYSEPTNFMSTINANE